MRKLVLLVAVGLAAAAGFSLSTLKAEVKRGTFEIAQSIAERSGAEVSVGDVAISLLPRPAVEVRDVSVAMPAADGPRPIVQAPSIRVYPKLLPLLLGRAAIGSLEAVEPALEVRRTSSGTLVTFLPPGALDTFERSPFVVTLRGGTLTIEDESTSPAAYLRAGDLDAEVFPAASDGSIRVRAEAVLLGEGSHAQLEASLRRGQGPTGGDWLKYSLEVSEGSAEALQRAFPLLAGAELGGAVKIEASGEGFIGERSTEVAPAEPLVGRLAGETSLVIAGRAEALSFDLRTAVDDKRYQIRSGSARWAGVDFSVSGWLSRRPADKLSLRLQFADVDAATIISGYGMDERWQPEAVVSGMIRVSGTVGYPLLRYEASMPSLKFKPWPPTELRAGPVKVRGSLLAINADINGSFEMHNIEIASVSLPQAIVGVVYWHDKLTVSALNASLWGGSANLSLAYYPEQGNSVEGGGTLENADASDVFSGFFSDLGLDVGGRADVLVQVGIDSRGPWAIGRVGLHRGRIGPRGFVHDVISSVLAERGQRSLLGGMIASYPHLLAPDHVRFRRSVFDFQTRDDGLSIGSLKMDLEDGELRGEGLIDKDGQVAGWGTLILAPGLSQALSTTVAEVTPLVGTDGSLRVPVRLHSGEGAGGLEPDERFIHALARSARGEKVGPFVTMESESSILSELPTLEDHFGR